MNQRKNREQNQKSGKITEDGRQNSFWLRNTTLPAFPVLSGEISREAVVIGGGLCGILTAFYLQRAWVKTVVL